MEKGKLTTNGVHLQDHEYETVKLFLELGNDIDLIPRSQIRHYHTPDMMMNGVAWEIKAPIGDGRKTIENTLQGAADQSRNVIVDLFRCKMNEDRAIRECERQFKLSKGIKRLKVIKKDRQIIDFP